MVKWEFQIKDPAGLLPEAAGRLVKEAIQCTSRVQIRKGEKSGDAKFIYQRRFTIVGEQSWQQLIDDRLLLCH